MRNKRIITDEIELARTTLAHDVEALEGVFRSKIDRVKQARARFEQVPDRIADDPWRAVGIAFALGALLAWMRD